MRTIRVTGNGRIKLKPDMIRITLSLEGCYPEYGETLRRSSQDTERLKDLFAGFGFERSDLKTLNFRVDTEYESYMDLGAFKQRFAGYKFFHWMKVELDFDNELLGRVLYALANCDVKTEFRISYTVKDPEVAKNELLGQAIADATEKASVLAKAAGLTLKEIRNIDYSWGMIDFEIKPMDRMLMPKSCRSGAAAEPGYNLDIQPDDITVSDTVMVIWEIA